MAGFCRNCGSPLADGQGFCTKCGTGASGPPARPAAQAQAASPRPAAPPSQVPPTPSPAVVATPAKSGMSTFAKILIAFVVVVCLFGAAGIAGVWYLAHRVKEKVHDMGLDQVSSTSAGPVLGGADPCGLLSKSDVAAVIKMDVVRAEAAPGSDAGCEYSVMGNYPDMIAAHMSALQKDMAQTQKDRPTDAQQQQIDSMMKSFFRSADAQQGSSSPARHAGESPVFVFGVSNAGAQAQMSMTRMAFGRMGPAFTELPGIGDEAFDVGGAMILARKGDKVVHVMYMMCPCTKADATSLVQKIVGNM